MLLGSWEADVFCKLVTFIVDVVVCQGCNQWVRLCEAEFFSRVLCTAAQSHEQLSVDANEPNNLNEMDESFMT